MGRSFHAVDLVDVTHICHDGQKNMKWGLRLYQEPGTNHWTELGKLRYGQTYNQSLYEAAKKMTAAELKAAVDRKNAEESFINAYKQESKTKQKLSAFGEKILDKALNVAGDAIGNRLGNSINKLAGNTLLTSIEAGLARKDEKIRSRIKLDKEEEGMTKAQRKEAKEVREKAAKEAAKQKLEKEKADSEAQKAANEKYVAKKKAEAEQARKEAAEAKKTEKETAAKTQAAKEESARLDAAAKLRKQQQKAEKKQADAEKKQERKEEAKAKEQAKKFGEEFSKFVKLTSDVNVKMNGKSIYSKDIINSVFEQVTGMSLKPKK